MHVLRTSLAAVIAATVIVACSDNSSERSRESCGAGASCPTTPSPATIAIVSTLPSTSTTGPSTSTEPTSVASSTAAPPTTVAEGIVRPAVDPSICKPLAASEGVWKTFDLHLFARPEPGPFPIQIIADPDAGPTAGFAVVLRYTDPVDVGPDTVEINGWNVAVDVYANGNGEASWNLADGGHAYVRSRRLDRDALVGIVGSLEARGAGAAVPGFDYQAQPGPSSTLQLVAEHMSTGVSGQVAHFDCLVDATTYDYRIDAIAGDPVFQYVAVIDRATPLSVGFQQGTLITIQGFDDPKAPTVGDVVNADPDTWADLLSHPVV